VRTTGDTDITGNVPIKRLRSSVELFDWKNMCFFVKCLLTMRVEKAMYDKHALSNSENQF